MIEFLLVLFPYECLSKILPIGNLPLKLKQVRNMLKIAVPKANLTIKQPNTTTVIVQDRVSHIVHCKFSFRILGTILG